MGRMQASDNQNQTLNPNPNPNPTPKPQTDPEIDSRGPCALPAHHLCRRTLDGFNLSSA
jgi:hypothetical protein